MKLNLSTTDLNKMAHQIRLDVLESVYAAGSGHPGGSFSMAEIISVLYFNILNVDPLNPLMEERDRFVLSKGHAAPVYYAALARRGYFEISALKTLRQIDSFLQGHPDRKKVPGVDMSTGSLGQGISAAAGMALYAKMNNKGFRVYCALGDGEMQEGQVWEAIMSAAHFKMNNFTVLLDNNDVQLDGNVGDIMSIYPIKEKIEAFGWDVMEVNGHDVTALSEALEKCSQIEEKPQFIICKTIKGKGISFMENQAAWHGATINDEQYKIALSELRMTEFMEAQ